jgi:putative acetyltransferase
MEYAESEFCTTKVNVNEQNPEALGFYQHLGYKIVGRSEFDGQGRPFPILHLEKTFNKAI